MSGRQNERRRQQPPLQKSLESTPRHAEANPQPVQHDGSLARPILTGALPLKREATSQMWAARPGTWALLSSGLFPKDK